MRFPFRKKFWRASSTLARDIDLSDIQTRQQVIRRQIHEDDFCRLVEHPIWYGFANANSYDAGYDIGETLHAAR